MKYNNYHCHTHFSNLRTPDSVVKYDDYINRIKELGYGCLFTTEHGSQGNYLQAYQMAKQNNIPFRFGVEAYWVTDNQEKDKTNNHIIILAKNMNGLKKINYALSMANIDGFYHKPRLSLSDILNLPKDDVFITTACVGFNGYGFEKSKEIILQLHNKFGNNFMLEVQPNNTELQKEWNKFLLTFNIPIIAGMDSHFIYPQDKEMRDAFIRSKNIAYDNEEGWYMDFPDYNEVIKRFELQGVLTKEQIVQSLENTLVIDDFEDVEFDYNIKIPNIFPNKTYEERVEYLINILRQEFKKKFSNLSKEEMTLYGEEVKKEINIIVETKMTDYFILNYHIVKRATELGGRLTLTGRGSAVSFITSMLLGFTTIDRIKSPIQLYPERFLSVSRVLEAGSIADIDFNTDNPEIFIQAQKEILGEHAGYYMIAFGKLQEKSAFKTYARSKNIDFDTSNIISKGIDNYNDYIKHNEDGEVNINKYIPKEHIETYNDSQSLIGTIESGSRSPCAICTYNGNTLEDIGVMRLRDDIITVIDGITLDAFKYVKNDFLKVNVVKIIYDTFKEAGIKPLTTTELLDITRNDEKVWRLFHDGITIGLNQIEQDGARQKCMKYKPTNISELSAFIAGIRPGFASMLDTLLSRKPFSYDIPEFDKLIQTEELPYSFVLYQESVMKTLEYAGFPSDICYSLLKSISKKKKGVVEKVKDQFIEGFMANDISKENADKVWQIIEDNVGYSFNSSHSLSVALDSLYGAYLKAYYPYEFYKVMLELTTEDKDLERVSSLKQEMKYFDIMIGDLKYGIDNTGFIIDKENNRINQSLKTVKYINDKIPHELNNIYKSNQHFVDTLFLLDSTSANSRQLDVLIKIGYFNSTIKKSLTVAGIKKKLKNKTYKFGCEYEEYIKKHSTITNTGYKNLDKIAILKDIWNDLPDEKTPITEKLAYEMEFLGYVRTIPDNLSIAKVKYISNRYKSANLESLRNGNSQWFKFDKGITTIHKGDVLILENITTKSGWNGRQDKVVKKFKKILGK